MSNWQVISSSARMQARKGAPYDEMFSESGVYVMGLSDVVCRAIEQQVDTA